MGRRVASTTGLRELLLADYRRSLERWRISGRVYPKEQALAAGEQVVVGSADLMRALLHAGLPFGDYAYGGRHWRRTFVFDERDQLREVVD